MRHGEREQKGQEGEKEMRLECRLVLISRESHKVDRDRGSDFVKQQLWLMCRQYSPLPKCRELKQTFLCCNLIVLLDVPLMLLCAPLVLYTPSMFPYTPL